MKKIVLLLAFCCLLTPRPGNAGIILSGDSATARWCIVDTSTFSVSGTGNVMTNLTIYNTIIDVAASCTITNTIGYNPLGNDITIAAATTVTGTYNLFEDAAKAGTGTYSDGSSTSIWSSAPEFRAASDGDFSLQGGSPCKNAGTDPFSDGDGDQYDLAGKLVWSDATDAPVRDWANGVEIGAYGVTSTSFDDDFLLLFLSR